MITIIIFSSNRIKYLSELIADIKKCNLKKKNKIILVSYNETRLNIKKIKNITKESYFSHFIEKQNLTFAEKLKKYSKMVKTKFFWHMSDDDRIKLNAIEDINHILKKNKNLSGMTINHEPMSKIKKKIYNNKINNLKLENFNLSKNAYQLGLNSAQIYNTRHFIRSSKFSKDFYNDAYYHTGIILFLIASKKKWKYLRSKMIIYRYGMFNIHKKNSYLQRLDDEFKGYLKPSEKLFTKKNYKEIFKNIFYINILSWVLFNIKLNGKNKTFKVILDNYKYFPLNLYSIIILIGIYIFPINFLNFLKRIKSSQKI